MRTKEGLIPFALDTETYRIGPGALPPKMVCASVAYRTADDNKHDGILLKHVYGNHPDDELELRLTQIFSSKEHLIIFANGAYDLAVIAKAFPKMIPLIFQALEDQRIDDVQIREREMNLSTHGQLEMMRMPDWTSQPIKYNLAVLEGKYLGLDRSAQKAKRTGEGSGDAAEMSDVWQLNYDMLDGWRAADYPNEAHDYALEDAAGTLQVWEAQEVVIQDGRAFANTSRFQCAAHLALYLATCRGFLVDEHEVARIRATVDRELAPDRLDLLTNSGVLRPGAPPSPHSRGTKEHTPACQTRLTALKNLPPDARTANDAVCNCPPKMKAAVAPTRDMEKLGQHIATVCESHGIKLKTTATGKVATDGDFIEQLVVHDKTGILKQYQEREEISKIVSTYLPVLENPHGIVHFNYNVLVETGRTSSYGARKGSEALYPCTNGQNQPKGVRGIEVRHCYVPRPGLCLWDVDYSTQELACVGQITKNLFGQSRHFDLYNAGVDLHAYLAAQLALRIGKDEVSGMFRQACADEKLGGDLLGQYKAFMRCKKAEGPLAEFFKYYRTYAKPTGLGYPGGLGAEKFVTFSRASYGIIITPDEAREMKQVWIDTYPEMVEYFKWASKQFDDWNPVVGFDDETGDPIQGMWYTSPLGMIRRGTTYCGVANGMAMQTPGAEISKLALYRVTRECYDPTQGSVLFGCRPIAFVHDQIIGETTADRSLWDVQCKRVATIMEESMVDILPDIKPRTEALLTTRWSKQAIPLYAVDGKTLIPWEPAKEKAA